MFFPHPSGFTNGSLSSSPNPKTNLPVYGKHIFTLLVPCLVVSHLLMSVSIRGFLS